MDYDDYINYEPPDLEELEEEAEAEEEAAIWKWECDRDDSINEKEIK